MKLSEYEKAMLGGEHGEAAQQAMELLVAIGECYDADHMLPVGSAHLVSCNPPAAGKGGTLFYSNMAKKGGRFIIPTTTNPACLDPWAWQEMGFTEELYQTQMALSGVIATMGAFLCNTCTPYLIGHTPRMREHVAWSESSAVVYVNAIIGGRTNKEGTPSALASGLTGRTPAYGYHLERNRYGKIKIDVATNLTGSTDYATLGYFVGLTAQDMVPIITGIPRSCSQHDLICLGAGLTSSGSAAHFHAVGVTPEAPTEQIASGSTIIRSSHTVEFGLAELIKTEESLSQVGPDQADLVILGCPHCSIHQLRTYAKIFSGREVKDHVEIWVLVHDSIKRYGEQCGYVNLLESSGVKVVSNMCPSATPATFFKSRGYSACATDSPKMAYLLSGGKNLPCYYGSPETIIDAVTSQVH